LDKDVKMLILKICIPAIVVIYLGFIFANVYAGQGVPDGVYLSGAVGGIIALVSILAGKKAIDNAKIDAIKTYLDENEVE